jgi:surface glycoprotein (TIGR04207 family)
MTNDNNTRSKANAVFFSVIMVISMVAVGFAAAPAAAVTDGEITFDDQQLTGSDEVSTAVSITEGDDNVTVVVTYNNDEGDTVIAGLNESVNTSDVGTDVSVTLGDTSEVPGSHTAHLFNVSAFADTGLEEGDTVSSAQADAAIDAESAVVTSSSGENERSAGDDIAYNNTNVYQGEEDVTYVDDDGTVINAQDLEGTSGSREGTPLQDPIPQDADRGVYADNGASYNDDAFAVTVVEPRISTAEVQFDGSDVSQIASSRADGNENDFVIAAEWNFNEAEDVDVTVEDPSGADITNEVVIGDSTLSSDDGSAEVGLDLSTEDAGEYTITFEGSGDVDYDSVVQEYTIETTSQDSLSLSAAEDSVTRGTNLDYTVSGGVNGEQHIVAIDESDFREDVSVDNAEDIFRNVQDVESTGAWNGSAVVDDPADSNIDNIEYAFAVVEIDGTTAAGSIETQ